MDDFAEKKYISNTRKLVVALIVTTVIVVAVGIMIGCLIYSVTSTPIGPEHFGIPTR